MIGNQPDFHDGSVDGVFTSKLEVQVFLRTPEGAEFTLILHGVDRLRIQDFKEGNIIFSVDFFEPE